MVSFTVVKYTVYAAKGSRKKTAKLWFKVDRPFRAEFGDFQNKSDQPLTPELNANSTGNNALNEKCRDVFFYHFSKSDSEDWRAQQVLM